MTDSKSVFELTVWPDPGLVSVVRRFIEELYERVGVEAEDISRIALASHELLENAVKYSSGGSTNIQIGVDRGEERDGVWIVVTNRPVDVHLDTLRGTFAEIEQAQDPFDFYRSLMKRPKAKGVSGLGLARIIVEGDMTLSMECNEGNVRIRARGDVEGRIQS
jgi:two-component sensor histidine kinase